MIDGADIRALDPSWLRRQTGVVLQENVLFNATVRENIALADPGLPAEQVIAAAKLAGAHDFICKMREGYDTLVGERGVSLSGGQRQRLAIARALVSDPRILIFDEATSALDYEFESIIHRNMRKIVQGRTVFIIAHRLSAVRIADRILTIEDGMVTEDGRHDELVAANGRYATLLRLQSGTRLGRDEHGGIQGQARSFPGGGAASKWQQGRKWYRASSSRIPALLRSEVAETPPSPLGRAVTYTIIAIAMTGLCWAVIGHVDIVAVASGKIVTQARTQDCRAI